MKPLTKRELLRLCTLLRRYLAEVRFRRGITEANFIKTVLGYIEEYLQPTKQNATCKEKR